MGGLQQEKLDRIKKLVSLITMLATISTAVFVALFITIQIPTLAFVSATSCLLFLLVHFLNKSGKVKLSRAMTLVVGLTAIFFLCFFTPSNFNFDLIFLIYVAVTFAFHDFTEFKTSLTYIIVGVFAFTALEFFVYKGFDSGSIGGNLHVALFYFTFLIFTILLYNIQKITHLAEEKYTQSEERYHKMVAEVEDYSILLLDPNGIILNWNKGAEKIKGYTGNEIIGKSFKLFYGQKDIEARKPEHILETAIKQGTVHDEGWRVRKDGTPFWAVVTITALHDMLGNITGFSKVTRDITEKKKAEDALHQQAKLIKMLPDGIIYGTDGGKVVDLNEAAAKMFAVTKEEIIGRRLEEFVTVHSINDITNAARNELQKEDYWRGESEITNHEGKKLQVLMSILKTNNVDGYTPGWIAIYTDVGLLHVNNELKDALQRIEQHARYLEQFSYISAHDLKAPINIIQGLANYLVSGGSVNAEQKETQNMLKRTVDEMQRTYTSLNQILKLKKKLEEKESLVSENIKVQTILDEVIGTLQGEIQQTGARINIDTDGISEISFSPVYFKSICHNLVSNSIKYHDTKRPLKIDVTLRKPSDSEMILTVEDNGMGMNLEDNRHKLFGLFKRLHNHVEGEGVGLHIVKSIVDAYGGTIEVKSTPDVGSRFELRFNNIKFKS